MKKLIASAAIAATAFAGTAGMASAQTVVANNLVGINIDNLLNDNQVIVSDVVDVNNVAVPVGIAANVCDVNAAVLLAAIEDTGTTDCQASNSQRSQQGVRQVNMFDARN